MRTREEIEEEIEEIRLLIHYPYTDAMEILISALEWVKGKKISASKMMSSKKEREKERRLHEKENEDYWRDRTGHG